MNTHRLTLHVTALFFSGSMAAAATQCQSILPEDADLNADWAPLLQFDRSFERCQQDNYFVELARYSSNTPAARAPRAVLALVRITAREVFFVDANEDASGDRIRAFLPNEELRMDGDTPRTVPKREWRLFTLNTSVPCMYVRTYLRIGGGGRYETNVGRIIGNIRIDGYYCGSPGDSVDADDAEDLLDALRVRW